MQPRHYLNAGKNQQTGLCNSPPEMRGHPDPKGCLMDVVLEFERRPRTFTDPVRIISCQSLDGLPECFRAVEKALSEGLAVAGFLSYEAGYGFEERLRSAAPEPDGFPLFMMGCYRSPGRTGLTGKRRPAPDGQAAVHGLSNNMARASYDTAIEAIRDHIARGEVYQITYCLKRKFRWSGTPESLYRMLYREQPVPYPAFIRTPEFSVLSLSPEMFMKKTGARIVTKPMKGTWPRGSSGLLDDIRQKSRFRRDEKNRAENVMITDLLRNDLGRIGRDVRVPRLFEVARYRTCFQMTSTVTARVSPGLSVRDIFRSLFPSGSVTGAPKIRAMQLIRQLEPEPRRIYTGAIGCIMPDGEFFFNIPIRTLLLKPDHTGEMGVGGGIVWDSTPEGEWREGEWKSEFLRRLERPC